MIRTYFLRLARFQTQLDNYQLRLYKGVLVCLQRQKTEAYKLLSKLHNLRNLLVLVHKKIGLKPLSKIVFSCRYYTIKRVVFQEV